MSTKNHKPGHRKTVLVTGANGYIGNAVAHAFVAAGYTTYGLVRRSASFPELLRAEVIPLLGSPEDISFIPDLHKQTRDFDVIVSTTEDNANYVHHWQSIMTLCETLSAASAIKPLLIFSSGCKDYGVTGLHGSSGLSAHTEDSAFASHPYLQNRTTYSAKVPTYSPSFDAVVTRPSTIYGYTSSYYAHAFMLAAKSAESAEKTLRIPAPANSIMHGTHVADIACAYLALAESPRERIAGQFFNISSRRYETAQEVAEALAAEYGLDKAKIEYDEAAQPWTDQNFDPARLLWGWTQWVGSEKIRAETGWADVRPLFSEAIGVYRKAWTEAEREAK